MLRAQTRIAYTEGRKISVFDFCLKCEGTELKARNGQTRRRRLIQRGLLGESAPPVGPADVADDEMDNEFGEQFKTELEIDQATEAVLATEPSATHSRRSEPATEHPDSVGDFEPQHSAENHAGLASIQSLIHGTRDVTWVFTGDNIVHGALHTQGMRSCVEIFAERIRAEMRRAGDVIINTGIAGDTAPRLLRTLKRRVFRFRPEIVGLSIGINDAKRGPEGRNDFRREVREILDRIRTAGSIPLMILPHPVYVSAAANRADLPAYVEILREASLRDEVPCVDQWSDWLENWSDPEETRLRLADGRTQLGAAAHQRLAELMFWTLDIYDSDSPACRGHEVG